MQAFGSQEPHLERCVIRYGELGAQRSACLQTVLVSKFLSTVLLTFAYTT